MFQPGGGRELVLSLLRRIELEGENPDISASLRARLVRPKTNTALSLNATALPLLVRLRLLLLWLSLLCGAAPRSAGAVATSSRPSSSSPHESTQNNIEKCLSAASLSLALNSAQSSSSKAVFGITWPQQLSEPAPAPRARAGDDPSSPASSPRRGAIKPGEFREVHYHGDWMHRRVGDNEVGVLCRVLVRVSEAANRSLGLGPALRDKPAAEAPACLKARIGGGGGGRLCRE